jgi:hypothetical protein
MNLLAEIANFKSLRVVDDTNIKDRSTANFDQTSDELENENSHWESFFKSSCSTWFAHIKVQYLVVCENKFKFKT